MRHLTSLFASLMAILALSCQANTPTSPLDGGAPFTDEPGSELPIDGQDEGLRGLTALLTGDMDLKGSVIAPKGYIDSPGVVTQPAAPGELALIRLRATSTSKADPQTLYSDVRGPGGAYSSMTFLNDFTSQYKAIYVLRTEDLSVRVHNRPSFSGVLNIIEADVDYTFETKPIEDSSEPNDDENTSTITDRVSGKPLGLGTTATRSFFEYSASVKDREDWYTTTLTAGATYRYRLTSYNPRYGTWGYTLKLYNAAGTQIGSTSTMAVGNAAGNLQTPTIPSTGTYFLQIAGTPGTKSNNANVFFSLYGINVCQQSIAATPAFTPSSGTQLCPGSTGSWSALTTPLATGYSWNFGGGCAPNTSTTATPSVTLGANGTYNGTLITTSSCGAQITKSFTYTVGCSWVRSIGSDIGGTADAQVLRVLVDSSNRTHAIVSIRGTDLEFTLQEPLPSKVKLSTESSSLAYVLLDAEGALIRAFKLSETNQISIADFKVTSDGDLRLVGSFGGSVVDFDPGPGVLFLGTGEDAIDGFVWALTSTGTLQWAFDIGQVGFELFTRVHGLAMGPGDSLQLGGEFEGIVDFDPSGFTTNLTSTGRDGFWAAYSDAGVLTAVFKVGGPGFDAVTAIAPDNQGGYYLGGRFSDTAGFNNSGTTTRTSNGQTDGFCARYTSSRVLQWVSSWGGVEEEKVTGLVANSSGQPRILGEHRINCDFDPGAGTVLRTVSGVYTDAYLLALQGSTGNYVWVDTWGSTLQEFPRVLTQNPVNGDLGVYGEFQGTCDFNPGAGVVNRSSTSATTDLYLTVFSSAGTYRNVSIWNSSLGLTALGMGVGTDGRLVIGTAILETIDVNPGAGTLELENIGRTDGLMLRLKADGTFY